MVDMLKNTLIYIYIVTVLLLAGFARASTISIAEVDYNPSQMLLKISGQYIDGCNSKVAPQLSETQSLGEKIVAEIKLNPVRTSDFCTQGFSFERQFDMVLDVRTLGLAAGFTYVLNISGTSGLHTLEIALPKNSSVGEFETTEHKGQVVALGDGSFALVKNQDDFVMLNSTIDLSKYNGQMVSISGIEFVHQVGPIVEVSAQDPLHETSSNKPSVFVLNVFTVSK